MRKFLKVLFQSMLLLFIINGCAKPTSSSDGEVQGAQKDYSLPAGVWESTKSCTISTVGTMLSDGGSLLLLPFQVARFYLWDMPVGVAGSYGYMGSWGQASEGRMIAAADAEAMLAWAVTNFGTFIASAWNRLGDKLAGKEPHEQSAVLCGVISHALFALLTTKGLNALRTVKTTEMSAECAKSADLLLQGGQNLQRVTKPTQAVAEVLELLPQAARNAHKAIPSFMEVLNSASELGYASSALGFRMFDALTKSKALLRSAYAVVTDTGFVRLTVRINPEVAKAKHLTEPGKLLTSMAKTQFGTVVFAIEESSTVGDIILSFRLTDKSMKAASYFVQAVSTLN